MADGEQAGPPRRALDAGHGEDAADISAGLERLRVGGDLAAQRRHAWAVAAHLFGTADGGKTAAFESWHGEGDVFAAADSPRAHRGIRGFSRAIEASRTRRSKLSRETSFPDTPVFAYALYNLAAYEHIRAHELNRVSQLEALRRSGIADQEFAGERTIPPFPPQAVVIKTIWWPVRKGGVTTLPVWDPEENPPHNSGNSYLQWRRSVSIDPSGNMESDGQTGQPGRFGLAAFYHLQVDSGLAGRANRDSEARRASLVALGRPLEAGDFLVLVGVNFATKEMEDWVWGTLWWHDRADRGPFAADRPEGLAPVLSRYLLQVAFDAETPREAGGEPHICFNPWLEGRFPDGGHGGGVVSNCLTCHQRASYPPVNFLPVSRGVADRASDPAFAPGRLRTGFLWSIPLHATP